MTQKSKKTLFQKWSIAIKLAPIILLIAALKFAAHKLDLEVMELYALFTILVAGTIFLIGFLISGILADYKPEFGLIAIFFFYISG